MTWILSTVIRLLLRAAGPLVRRGLPHLAMAVMATLVCGAALVAGYGLLALALWLAAVACRWSLCCSDCWERYSTSPRSSA
ncbi:MULTISPECIES: hypothetical protein [unclassified Streptomyces]|uniref:hypothetical protein n=1 Tax=unclassified Streptomyces TaxID=2593676 RepID=UPI0033EA5878